jgi:hypothetical protein
MKMTRAELDNAIYKIIIDELEPRENKGMLKGNAHHIAQKLTADILKKIKEKEPKRKEPKTFVACYKSNDRWMLITREIATLVHATKKAEAYKEAGHVVKILPLNL